ncbi:GNAT family N-acetyltransferase [Longimicrobium sp.]|jgi:GNAT superfamily N-acetyltransferase|uniref:GNAT family N-acetyltransferase n=1 Tax=Longimicrobium sp. TaxID=2029185 RepID=UPI002ED7FCDE
MVIRPLERGDDREGFRCGEPALDTFLRKHALSNHESGLSRIYVAVDDPASRVLLGYYALSNTSIAADQLAAIVTQRLPRYPIPAILIGKLATDERRHGRGLGRDLLKHALQTSLRAAELSAALGVLVDAKSTDVMGFYERYGFQVIPPSKLPQPMFLPMATLRTSLP